MTSEQVDNESLRAKVVGLEAKLSIENDKDKQIDQLMRQLLVANSSNDKLIVTMNKMEIEHANAL